MVAAVMSYDQVWKELMKVVVVVMGCDQVWKGY